MCEHQYTSKIAQQHEDEREVDIVDMQFVLR